MWHSHSEVPRQMYSLWVRWVDSEASTRWRCLLEGQSTPGEFSTRVREVKLGGLQGKS